MDCFYTKMASAFVRFSVIVMSCAMTDYSFYAGHEEFRIEECLKFAFVALRGLTAVILTHKLCIR